ncbi:short chain dehydrogenase, partial [Streptomyces sp. SID14478]|nr:short chain dehydrogenase [Streptomyces sp. SID14478]
MADRYLNFTGTAPGRFLTRRLGLPQPAPLRRWSPERPSLEGQLLHFTAGTSAHRKELSELLARTGLDVRGSLSGGGADRPAGIVVDATAVTGPDALAEVHAALH